MERIFFGLGSILAGIAVGLGAFGAHGLRGILSPEDLVIFETGVRYQMYHALALLGVAWAVTQWETVLLEWSGWLFVLGILVFSGSLYILVLTGQRWLGAVTPLGGLALILGWVLLASAVFRA
ncbi:MAG TPA: DUF423 domain-containing protein [Gemmatimonadetes bacterium]|jgi:uncharacterized membrane protein YgdD (TMEM256/DUF423 family)|nr:DUF423 domain-containing protein [Gemmatimonadota bacterium]|tara:strand:+ start:191 stop:559 length:369 start_codon:yes stop_codon:yes gene_type:complete